MRLLKRHSKKIFSYWWILLLIVLPILFYWRFWAQGKVPSPADIIVGMYYPWRNYTWGKFVAGVPIKNGLLSDVVSQLYPWRLLASNSWLNGQVPLWDSYILGGLPLAANVQTAAFYPINFIFFLHPSPVTWGITIVLQTLLSFYFMNLFLRAITVDKRISLFGALAFAFNGFFLFWLEWGNVVAVCSWLPLALWAIEKMGSKINWPNFRYWLVFLLAISMAILAGHFQMAFFVGLICFIYALIKSPSRAVIVTCLGLAALLLTAFQVLPAAEAHRLSIRDSEGLMENYNYGFIKPVNFICLLAPNFFGNPGTGNWPWFGTGIELTPYVGLVTFVFFIYYLFSLNLKEKKERFSLLVFLAGLLFIFPNPLSWLVYRSGINIPGISSSPANRAIFIFDLGIVLGGVIGLGKFLSAKGQSLKQKRFWLPFLLITLIFSVLWAVCLYSLMIKPLIGDFSFYRIAVRNLCLPTVTFLALILSVFLFKRQKISGNLFLTIVVGFLVFELFGFGWKLNSFSDPDWFFPETEEVAFLKEASGYHRVEGAIPANMKSAYGLSAVNGYEILIPKTVAEFLAACNYQSDEGVEHPVGRYAALANPLGKCGQLYSVSHILADYDGPSEENVRFFKKSTLVSRIWEKDQSVIFKVENVLPRSFLVDDYQVFEDKKAVVRAMFAPDADNWEKKLFLIEEPNLKKEISFSLEGDSQIIDYQPERVVVDTWANKDALLFLSDNYYPGWQAYIDGQETKIYRADYAFRAVVVPQGEHTIVFSYYPQSFIIGVKLSLTVASGLLLMVIFLLVKDKNQC